MKKREIRKDIYLLPCVDWHRRLFDALIPLPDGTSYNAYLVRGNAKTALIDTADPTMLAELMSQLAGIEKIDYIISNHAEQDHSGLIPAVMEKYSRAMVITSAKGKSMLADHLAIPENRIKAVADGETIDLGGRSLKFIYTPWVHWPETMATYLVEEKILFSCDFFGSHLATSDLFVTDESVVYEAAKRYYAEIMMPFHQVIIGNLEKLKTVEIEIIAPSHGPLYPRPAFIMDAYRDWTAGPPRNLVVIPFISMHGSTAKMVNFLIGELVAKGVAVLPFDLAVTDLGKLAIALVDAATIVIGTPTVHLGPHPAMSYAAGLANSLRPKAKFASIIGSYGWSSKAIESISGLVPNLKVEMLNPVLCKGLPRESDFAALSRLAEEIASGHSALKLK
ncbi:MAG: FprA family A-type flavoprotein [Kiritimatiellia bacterium]|nr:FprA family A-type flavoprotein [Kiritimatiellia bacterium]